MDPFHQDSRCYESLLKFSGYKYFENIIAWILDIEDFIEYVKILNKKVEVCATKASGSCNMLVVGSSV